MAKYDHGGGCACGLSRFCDCSNATAQDKKDREEYDRLYGKKPAVRAKKEIAMPDNNMKATNPKDAVGIRKPRFYSGMSAHVDRLVSIGMMEGAMKYGRHNYRPAAVRASVYYDAAREHLGCWWEGEDVDPDVSATLPDGTTVSLPHIIKAICSLYVLADAIVTGNLVDDRPPRTQVPRDVVNQYQPIVDMFFKKYPNPEPAFTEKSL